MATKRVIRTVTREDDEDDRDLINEGRRPGRTRPPSPAEEEESAGYSEFLSKFQGAKGCRVKVHRQTPRGRQYCFFGTPEEIDSEETIRLYHAKQPYAHEEGLYYLTVEAGDMRSCFPVHVAPQVGTPGTEPAPAPNGGMAEFVRELQRQNQLLQERLLTQEKTPVLEMVQAMESMDRLRGGQKEMPVEVLLKAVEIGRQLNAPAADDWTGLIKDLVKEAAPFLPMLLSQLKPKPQAEQTKIAALPAPGEKIEDTMEPAQQERMILQQCIQYLKKKALAQSDPGLYIDLIVDNREDALYARLISQIVEQDFSAFVALDPEIEKPQYREFFSAIYNGIRSVFVPKHPVGKSAGGKGGHGADAPANGTAGTGGGGRS